MWRIVVQDLPLAKPTASISLETMRAAALVELHVFGRASLGAGTPRVLGPRLARRVASPWHVTGLMHLGSALAPVLLGPTTTFGSAEQQTNRLHHFLGEIPDLLGEFDSFWPETFANIRATAATFGNAETTVNLFLADPDASLFEWDDVIVRTWIAELPVPAKLVTIVSHRVRHAHTTFEDWLVDIPPLIDTLPATLVLSHRAGTGLPEPQLRVADAISVRTAPHVWEILLPTASGESISTREIVRLPGVVATEISVLPR
jgi:hypothetical protein